MTRLTPARSLLLGFGLATCAATFTQCGDGRDAPANGGAPEQTGQQVNAPSPASTQDPQPTPPADTLHLLISGSMHGHLEPCGCASGQLGGLARRAQHIGERRNYDLLLEGGDVVGGATELDTLKLWTSATVLFDMLHYDALGVGLKDLSLGRDDYVGFLEKAPVVATNLECTTEGWPGVPFRDKAVRDFRVRIGSLLLPELPAELQQDETLRRTHPATAWSAAFADVDADVLRIVMLYGDDADIRELVPQLDPRPDLAIAIDEGYIEPNHTPIQLGDVPLVFAGIRGRVPLDARLWRENGKPRVVLEHVQLAASKTLPGGGGDPDVKRVILEHRQNVKDMEVLTAMANRHDTPNGATYLGSSMCKSCHATAYQKWSESKHAHAWQTLVDAENDPKRYGWPVTAYPDCVACHSVGYGQKTGFETFATTPDLANVGCERCHGPGSEHVQSGGKQKLGIIGGELASIVCTQCHDYEQSPTFVYNERWALIEHGKEK